MLFAVFQRSGAVYAAEKMIKMAQTIKTGIIADVYNLSRGSGQSGGGKIQPYKVDYLGGGFVKIFFKHSAKVFRGTAAQPVHGGQALHKVFSFHHGLKQLLQPLGYSHMVLCQGCGKMLYKGLKDKVIEIVPRILPVESLHQH